MEIPHYLYCVRNLTSSTIHVVLLGHTGINLTHQVLTLVQITVQTGIEDRIHCELYKIVGLLRVCGGALSS